MDKDSLIGNAEVGNAEVGKPVVGTAVAGATTSGEILEVLYREHYRSLVKMAALYVDTAHSAEEVVQDAFVKLLGGNYEMKSGSEAAYLRSAVLNGARSRLRRRITRRRFVPDKLRSVPAAEIEGLGRVEHSAMLKTLRTLPERQASVLILRYYLDLSEAEIAETLGMARGSVKSHAHRGLAKLAKILEKP